MRLSVKHTRDLKGSISGRQRPLGIEYLTPLSLKFTAVSSIVDLLRI